MRHAHLAFVFVVAFCFFVFPGCGNDGNSVVEHSGEAPTAAEQAEYEAEMAGMEAER